MVGGKVDEGPWQRLPRWPCELCGTPAGAAGICAPCRAELPWIGPACPFCARPRVTPGPCAGCRGAPVPWRRAIAPLAWRFPVDALIGRFKYGGALHYGALLGRLLGDHCQAQRPDAIVPVPLHRARLLERGFNQAQELARPVAAALGVPLLSRACRRTRATAPQAGLAADRRYQNLAGAFTAGPAVRALHIAMIDDVLTTGSTAAALGQALLEAGAASVEAWAVARGGTGLLSPM